MHKQIETRLRFVGALSEVMHECPLEKVKVSHLCERLGVSRATFYLYFQDIFDVPTWYWDHLMNKSLYRMGIDQGLFEAHLKSSICWWRTRISSCTLSGASDTTPYASMAAAQ